MASLIWGTSPFDELVDKATSELLPAGQEDLALNLEICDQIRSKQVLPKKAMQSLKRRIAHSNPNVQLSALSLTDTCVKNGGQHFLLEIASREFMDNLILMVKDHSTNYQVKLKILSLIQTWGIAARGKAGLSFMTESYNILKGDGQNFPPIDKADSILLETAAPPEWTDSDVCERCRTPFTITNRKHHCRQCGKTFCQQCSSKNMALPHLGLTQEVRVCDGCYLKNILDKKDKTERAKLDDNALSSFTNSEVRFSSSSYGAPLVNSSTATGSIASKREAEDFDADIKKAIELSLKEEERRKDYGAGYIPAASLKKPELTKPESTKPNEEEDDPDLAAAIAASLRETHISSTASNQYGSNIYSSFAPVPPATDLTSVEMENIELFSALIERIQVAGGNVVADPQIQALYEKVGTMQPKLVKSLDEVTRRYNNFVAMHDKVTQCVKLYDHLLEERLSNATYYRNQQAAAYARPTSPQQYHAGALYMSPAQSHSSIYPTVNTYPSTPPQQMAASSMYPTAATSTSSQSYMQYNNNLYSQSTYTSTSGQASQPPPTTYPAVQSSYNYTPVANATQQQSYSQPQTLQQTPQQVSQQPYQQIPQQVTGQTQNLYSPIQQPVQEAPPLIEF